MIQHKKLTLTLLKSVFFLFQVAVLVFSEEQDKKERVMNIGDSLAMAHDPSMKIEEIDYK